jgi:hypothetical protein
MLAGPDHGPPFWGMTGFFEVQANQAAHDGSVTAVRQMKLHRAAMG